MFSPSLLLLAITLGSSATQALTTLSLKRTQGADHAFQRYATTIGVGNPPTYYNVAIDGSSAIFSVGTKTPYVRTNSSIPTGRTIRFQYNATTTYIDGPEFLDQVTIAPGLVIKNQSIVTMSEPDGSNDVDGILGIGLVTSTQGSVEGLPDVEVPTVADNAFSQGVISTEVIGLYLAPTTSANDSQGELTFGGFDSSKFTGPLGFTPLTKTFSTYYFWAINITKVIYGNNLIIIPTSTTGMVDVGRTRISLADDFFETYMSAIPGSSYDNITELLTIPESSIGGMQALNFTIGDAVYSLTPQAQLIPESENVAYGGVPGVRYSCIIPNGFTSDLGIGLFLGQKFMERYYSVYDTDKKQIGFAETKLTFA